MKKFLFVFVVIITFAIQTKQCLGKEYPLRWFYLTSSLRNDKKVEDVTKIINLAGKRGLNGMVFDSPGLEKLDLQGEDYHKRIKKISDVCKQNGIEIIPMIFSIGRGGTILNRDQNLAAGIPVKNVPFYTWLGEARLLPDPNVSFLNGGFEKCSWDQVIDYQLQDAPGLISFTDKKEVLEGRVSIRFEKPEGSKVNKGRIMQKVAVNPFRCYKVTCWVKTENLKPSGCFWPQVHGEDKRILMEWGPKLSLASKWQKIVFGFNSCDNKIVKIYFGLWGWESGKLWLDDISIEEVGVINVISRAGAPVTITDKKKNIVYKEGLDYAPLSDPKCNFKFDHYDVPIKILPGSRINDDDRLTVNYYQGIALHRSQVSVCMSEPLLYEIMEEEVKTIDSIIKPNKYFLSMDEIRQGGLCLACEKRNLPMSQILGDCITKQVKIIRDVNPEAEIFIWSDMLDPNHNARKSYYLLNDDTIDVCNYIPRDINIVCWYHEKREKSLKHFSVLGFKTIGATYYDKGLYHIKDWLDALDNTNLANGIMYTTWKDDYELLGAFGDLVTAEKSEEDKSN